jgi:hypothetical protein
MLSLEIPDLNCRYFEIPLPPGRVTTLAVADVDLDAAVRADLQVLGEPVRLRWDGGDPAQNRGVKLLTNQLVVLHGEALRRVRLTPSAPGSDLLPLFPSQVGVALYYEGD